MGEAVAVGIVCYRLFWERLEQWRLAFIAPAGSRPIKTNGLSSDCDRIPICNAEQPFPSAFGTCRSKELEIGHGARGEADTRIQNLEQRERKNNILLNCNINIYEVKIVERH